MKLRAASKPRRKSPNTVRQELRSITTSGGASTEVLLANVRARIAEMAYELYQQRGGHDGHDVADWLAAEQRVMTEGQGASRRSVMV